MDAREHYDTKLSDIDSAETLCEIAGPLIRSKARRLVRQPGFTPSDQEDIEQEAVARLLDRFIKCQEPNLPVFVFIGRVVGQSIANQLENRFAQRRNERSKRSLHESVRNEGKPEELGNLLDHDRRKPPSRPVMDYVELGLDFEDALAGLTEDERQLCQILRANSISAAAAELATPRTTLNDKVRKIRRELEDRDLEDYIE